MYPSDQKKMLSLPFYLAKRQEAPSPRPGQNFLPLFKEITGMDYFGDAMLNQDMEEKITEFDYEKYVNPEILKNMDTESEDFKEMIRALNYVSKTNNEALQYNKQQFSKL